MYILPRQIKLNFPKKNPAMISTRVPSTRQEVLKIEPLTGKVRTIGKAIQSGILSHHGKTTGNFRMGWTKMPLNAGVIGCHIFIIYIYRDLKVKLNRWHRFQKGGW